MEDKALENYYALRVYLVLCTYTKEGKGITIIDIENKLEEIFGEKKPSKDVTNRILKFMSDNTSGTIRVAKDSRRRYYLVREILPDTEATNTEQQQLIQRKALLDFSKENTGIRMSYLLDMLRTAIAKNQMLRINRGTINEKIVTPVKLFTRNDILYFLYVDNDNKLGYMDVADIKYLFVMKKNEVNVRSFVESDDEYNELMNNPISFLNKEKKRDDYQIRLVNTDFEKEQDLLIRVFGKNNIKANPVDRNKLVVINGYYSDIKNLILNHSNHYILVTPPSKVKQLKEDLQGIQNKYIK